MHKFRGNRVYDNSPIEGYYWCDEKNHYIRRIEDNGRPKDYQVEPDTVEEVK